MDDSRKLMPYEHQLIEALDITKDEYLDFVAQQHVYRDIKEGTIFDARNTGAEVAIALIIVGTILQVVAALLTRPEKEKGGVTQSRDNVFAPRSGFNSAQQLASYGESVNLVYANLRKDGGGGVRVSTALLWSAMKSFGSSQYVQLLLLIGAGGIGRIDYERTAFGQTPIRDLVAQNYWLYFRPNGTGPIVKRNLLEGDVNIKDPGAIGSASDNIYRVIGRSAEGSLVDGFSSTVSPSASNRFGVYAPVPVNVKIETRFQSGNQTRAEIDIYASELNNWGSNRPLTGNGLIVRERG
jgi:hypothetical protein